MEPLKIRRVVTGHNQVGRAVVAIDETCTQVISRRTQHQSCVVWASDRFPTDNQDAKDGSQMVSQTSLDNGSIFRISEYGPGVVSRMHRTQSMDYAVILSGEIDMELEGQVVRLRQGDVVVQRGTMHNWVNPGTQPCRIAFVLLSAKKLEFQGVNLEEEG